MSARRIILWDIDHTLMDTHGFGRELSAQAFENVTGIRMRKSAKIDGITESVIFREIAKLHGLRTDRGDFRRFADALAEAHVTRAAELRERGHALPGAAAALDALARLPGIVQTVLTGNIQRVARIKLGVFGLDRHIVWDIGAFGEDDDLRAELVRIALKRAVSAYGESIKPADAMLIGDTPADVAAGLEADVPVVAVASGRSSVDDLREAGAIRVLPSLTDTAALVRLVQDEG